MAKEIYKALQPAIEKIIQRSKNPFAGSLSPAQASKGIEAALTTAKALLDDALLLFNHSRYARATAIAILAIEEYGKIDIIRRILLCKEGTALKKAWKEYRHHYSKNVLWLRPLLENKGLQLFDQLNIVHQEGFQHSRIPDDIKQAGFYSDFGQQDWLSPKEFMTRSVARQFIGIAQRLIPDEAALATPEALELFLKHIKPVNDTTDHALLEQAWLSFYQEAESMGFIDKRMAEKARSMIANKKLK